MRRRGTCDGDWAGRAAQGRRAHPPPLPLRGRHARYPRGGARNLNPDFDPDPQTLCPMP
jgi:hypothetical protein